jgi:sulfur carrier protein ThiS
MNVTLKLYATLTDYLPPSARTDNRIELDVGEDATLESVIGPFHLPPKLVHLVLVNGIFVPPEARRERRFRDGDVIAIWPPIAGG